MPENWWCLYQRFESLIVHVVANDLTNEINLPNNTKKIVAKTKQKSPNTVLNFSNIIIRKDKNNLEKLSVDPNSRLKNYCSQKNPRLIMHDNINENHLDVKKLHRNRNGITVSSQKICLILFWVVDFLIIKEICLVKTIMCVMILFFHNHMLERLIRIFVSVIWTKHLEASKDKGASNSRHWERLERKYSIRVKRLNVVVEELKQRITAIAAKVRRYQGRVDSYRQNRLF